jgi:hypothetical protein
MVQLADQNGQTIVPPLLAVLKDILSDITQSTASLPVNLTNLDTSSVDIDELNRLLRLYSRLSSHLAILQSIYVQTLNMQGRPTVAFSGPFSEADNVEILAMLGKVIRYGFLMSCLFLVIVTGKASSS